MSTNKYILAKDVKDWNGVTTITSPSGQTKTVEEVLKNYPDYKVLVDSEGNIIKGNISTNRKSTPAQDYRFLENIVKNDPNGPYAATNWLLAQLAMLPLSAIGTVAAPIAITAGGIVGGLAGDIGGHYLSDWLYENPDKPIEIFGKDIGITPRTATRIGGGLVGGFAGGAGAYATQEKLVKPYLIAREINRMPLTENNELPVNVGWGPKQTVAVSHKSNNPNELLLFNPVRYDVIEEGANPFGIWYQGKLGIPRTVNTGNTAEQASRASRARLLFSERPFEHTGELTLDKPLVTIGEVPNRSLLSYLAEQIGADGIIYNDVYDNGYNNNLVILSFKKPLQQKLSYSKLSPEERLGIPVNFPGLSVLYSFMEDPTKFWNTIFKPKYNTNRLMFNTTRMTPEELPGKVTIISKDSKLAIPEAMGHSHKGNTYIYEEYMDVIDPEEIVIHEAAHNFRDTNPDNIAWISNGLKLSDLYAPDEKFYLLEEINALDEAYSFVPEGRFSNMLQTLSQQIAEKASTNTLLQYAIWKLSKAKTVSELNAAIDKLSDDDILYMLQLTNGYGNDFVNYIASNPNIKSQAVQNIREALKYVPSMTGIGYGGYKLYENLTNNE